jgi:hypothetical protein
MIKKNTTPKKVKPNYDLDGDDADFLAALENGEIQPSRAKDISDHKKIARKAATNYLKHITLHG